MRKRESGQALIESYLLVVFVVCMVFAVIQVIILSFGIIVSYDAAQASVRASIVDKNPNYAGLYVFESQVSRNTGSTNIIPESIKVETCMPAGTKEYDYAGEKIIGKESIVRYSQKIMLPRYVLNRRNPWFRRTAACRMVKSPDTVYMYKAYPDANDW